IIQDEISFHFPLWIQWIEKKSKKVYRKKIIVNSREVNIKWNLSDYPRKIKVNPFKAVPGFFKLKKIST
ncbi:hypothetical protein NLB65_00335, partial [Candidatus Aminicenantes bacterium AC-335-B20]|nr:hypothetical protein [Candidatus Aminicenantes bacterium AC-335-B20]